MKRSRSQGSEEEKQEDDNINEHSDEEQDDHDQAAPSVMPGKRQRYSLTTPGNRSQSNAVRSTRSRVQIPQSDPHRRVPANHTFPPGTEQIGQGANSGRNWLVMRDGDNEPILRTSLLIVRCKSDAASRASPYPDHKDIIPAGTTLRDVCRHFPRHVWGEMLRIFISERWDARRMWELLPANFRNNANSRPWNYFQAAMGREADRMWLESNGTRRIPKKKARLADSDSPSPAPQASGQSTQAQPATSANPLEGVDLSNDTAMTVDQLAELARQHRRRAVELAGGILWMTEGSANERQAERYYLRRHTAWARRNYDAYQAVTGQPIGTRDALQMLERIWELFNSRVPGEPEVAYQARRNWYAWRNYTSIVIGLTDELETEFDNLYGSQNSRELEMDKENVKPAEE